MDRQGNEPATLKLSDGRRSTPRQLVGLGHGPCLLQAGEARGSASDDGNVYGLDRASGETLFTLAAEGRVYPSPAIVDGWAFFGSHDGNVYAFGRP